MPVLESIAQRNENEEEEEKGGKKKGREISVLFPLSKILLAVRRRSLFRLSSLPAREKKKKRPDYFFFFFPVCCPTCPM